jgi:hypothetical protein
MFKLLTKITADDHNMLINDTPASRKKVVLLANALFVPVLLWFFSAFAIAIRLFETSIFNGLIAGLIATVFIFIIDRSILISNGNKFITAFRIVMGLCIATIGSIMVDECIFHDDINHQFEANKENSIQAIKDSINSKYAMPLAQLAAIQEQKSQIWNNGIQDAKNETDGKGGSNQRGVGKIASVKLNLASLQQADYIEAKNNRDSLIQEKNQTLQRAENKINSSYGKAMLLHRIEALFELVLSNKIVALIYFIFTIFIWCLEFIVILFKINSAETNYEKKIRMIEKIGSSRIDKLVRIDNEWYEAGRGHNSTQEVRSSINKKSPTIYN